MLNAPTSHPLFASDCKVIEIGRYLEKQVQVKADLREVRSGFDLDEASSATLLRPTRLDNVNLPLPTTRISSLPHGYTAAICRTPTALRRTGQLKENGFQLPSHPQLPSHQHWSSSTIHLYAAVFFNFGRLRTRVQVLLRHQTSRRAPPSSSYLNTGSGARGTSIHPLPLVQVNKKHSVCHGELCIKVYQGSPLSQLMLAGLDVEHRHPTVAGWFVGDGDALLVGCHMRRGMGGNVGIRMMKATEEPSIDRRNKTNTRLPPHSVEALDDELCPWISPLIHLDLLLGGSLFSGTNLSDVLRFNGS